MDISGETPTPAPEPAPAPGPAPEPVVDVSGGVTDVSGGLTDISGGLTDISGGVTDVSGGVTDISGGLTDISGGQIAIQPTPPPPILLDDILSSMEVLRVTEAEHKSLLESIGTLSADSIRPRLIQWATSGFRNAYPIHEIYLSPPSVCSDGQTRSLQDYIQFVSGKTIQEHVAVLQARMPDIVVSFAYTGVSILVVVSKV